MMRPYVQLLVASLSFICAKGFAESNFAETLNFIRQYDKPIVLMSNDEQSQIVLSALHQGRVLTSTATGQTGISNGWLNKDALKNNKGNVGGEDRTWLAPIGSKFSLFYPKGKPILPENWRVPPALKDNNYTVVSQSPMTVVFEKALSLSNHQGSNFEVNLQRSITLLSSNKIKQQLQIDLPDGVNQVGYSVLNTLTNNGSDWKEEQGLITIWSMAMLQGYEDSISLFSIKPKQANVQSYLYPLDSSRLTSEHHLVFYKTDGKYRSKIGIPGNISADIMLSYVPQLNRLTVVKYSIDSEASYPISLEQANTQDTVGDVVNAYNHGNMDGSLLADSAFFELESSAPMLPLKNQESVRHRQSVFHFIGNQTNLDKISIQLVGINVSQTSRLFK